VGLAALILVSEERRSRQSLPFGMTATEIQARQAMAMGANPILIHIEDMAADLSAALTRLKSGGYPVRLVRSNAEAANHIHPQENVLLYAGDVKFDEADPNHLRGYYIAVKPLEPGCVDQELIDAEHAWSGIALLPGTLIRDVNSLVGDWALGPTLLRLAVQQGTEKRLSDGEPLGAGSAKSTGLADRLDHAAMGAAAKLPAWALPLIGLLPIALTVVAIGLGLASFHAGGLTLFLLAMAVDWFRKKTGHAIHERGIPTLSSRQFPIFCAGALLLIFSFSLASLGGYWELLAIALWWIWLHLFILDGGSKVYANAVTSVAITLSCTLVGQAYWAFPIILLHALASHHLNERSLGRH
jgi:hypothetical protein